MKTGFRGTFVISWTQTELDGLAQAPVSALSVGAAWQWHGEAARVDGPGDILVLDQSEETAALRRHAAKAVRRLVYAALETPKGDKVPAPDDPLLEDGFAVTDGVESYTATIVHVPGQSAPLLMFLGKVPPEGQDLWITHVANQRLAAHRTGDAAPEVICFTPGTRIATPDGPVLVRDLAEDDLILTKDDGPQPIRWIGWRRMSGARLFAMPELRPIRIRGGALGLDVPDDDLLVSPKHRLVIRGAVAQALFNTPEVLVAAGDLVNDHSVMVDRRVNDVTYVHLLLDRHQVVFANGVETESFHPATMSLDAVAADQQQSLVERVPGLDRDGSVYGAFARRMLSPAEAAILQFKQH